MVFFFLIVLGASCSRSQLTDLKPDIIAHHCDLAANLTAENFTKILQYTLNKLLKDYSSSSSSSSENLEKSKKILPAIHLRLFYQVMSTVPVDVITSTLKEFTANSSNLANLVYTVIPACNLHNYNTFLSICGLRYE